jgi:hypothetical protein
VPSQTRQRRRSRWQSRRDSSANATTSAEGTTSAETRRDSSAPFIRALLWATRRHSPGVSPGVFPGKSSADRISAGARAGGQVCSDDRGAGRIPASPAPRPAPSIHRRAPEDDATALHPSAETYYYYSGLYFNSRSSARRRQSPSSTSTRRRRPTAAVSTNLPCSSGERKIEEAVFYPTSISFCPAHLPRTFCTSTPRRRRRRRRWRPASLLPALASAHGKYVAFPLISLFSACLPGADSASASTSLQRRKFK